MNKVLSETMAPADEKRVVMQLAALAQSSRLRIFRELIKVFDVGSGTRGLAAGELASRMQMPAPTLSFHLKELTRAGLVSSQRQGRSVIYRVSGENIRALIDFMLKDCCTQCC